MARSGKPPSSNPIPVPPLSSSSANPGPSSSATLKQRRPGPTVPTRRNPAVDRREGGGVPTTTTPRRDRDDIMPWAARNKWMVYAVASGACAAFNGVFAKLTTNDLTAHIARGISGIFGLDGSNRILEIVVRGIFFGLNLFFNGVMWTLFTQALAKGNSTTQVSIMNTSTNFMITALLGFAIFSEALPPLWWVGATLLVAGNVIIGRKDEGDADANVSAERNEEEDAAERGHRGSSLPDVKEEDEDVPLLGNLDTPSRDR
ncbi:hypothetical protein GQX73_g2374 [Xylaria multiplex]|uniref:EamA domain-containing protein n=1 Tax=Xylaria multiplex TaxID=323545 RepID=A0A7C8MTN5_9PEZI|nr:hypothetical protein GQX73_g2374 [Xylaria multiplex]